MPNFPICRRPRGAAKSLSRLLLLPIIQCCSNPVSSIPSPSSITAIVASSAERSGSNNTCTFTAPASKAFATNSSRALWGLEYRPSEKSSIILLLILTSISDVTRPAVINDRRFTIYVPRKYLNVKARGGTNNLLTQEVGSKISRESYRDEGCVALRDGSLQTMLGAHTREHSGRGARRFARQLYSVDSCLPLIRRVHRLALRWPAAAEEGGEVPCDPPPGCFMSNR